ncbi:MAG: helix-turn-helix domain-containing protein [Planctomycetota bacterium]|nr:helix-turn-helix domain-containing protein [Planctomycetota bacterium]MDA1140302.1 helix-turn-helix domain-containing protein [Planctomycetota bacterium]
MAYFGWRPYVSVAQRRAKGMKEMANLRKQGFEVKPVEIQGRKIARTFWGEAWCDHLESFSDYENRLPRGRAYVRNGSVCHLDITQGEVKAMVSGSELYNITIKIKTLGQQKWADVSKRCAGQIGSMLELLQGKLSKSVMEIVTDRSNGLFPLPSEISLKCSCPDWAVMCKHVAAVLYGVGARLDDKPELLFLLRGVDHDELISAEVGVATADAQAEGGRKRLADDELADVFGIEMSEEEPHAKAKSPRRRTKAAPKTRKTSKDESTPSEKPGSEPEGKSTQTETGLTNSAADTQSSSPETSDSQPVTGKAVARLRKKFGMSQSQFAQILGVTAPSISNWEKKPGTLVLQSRSRDAWRSVEGLTKLQATKKLGKTH